MKAPLDRTPYPKHPRSRPIQRGIADGGYVYVQDSQGVIWVLEDGPHRHVRVLGNAEPAEYAGDLTIKHGRIKDVTKLSGAFQFDDVQDLLKVAEALEKCGFVVEPGAVRFFPMDGSAPKALR